VRRRTLLAAGLCAWLFAGCDLTPKTPFHGLDVTGANLGGELRLTDHTGQVRTLASFRGKVVAVFFGYTQCPDVCPTTLADMAKAMKLLGPDADRVQVLFVTVDPKRDTKELLAQYVPAFNPAFLGLYGDAAETAKAEKDFKIYAQERAGREPGSYTMDHTAQTFVFDREGKLRLVFPYGLETAKIAADLKVLLNG
jgi:protein SCO1